MMKNLRTRQTFWTEEDTGYMSFELLDENNEPYHTTVYLWEESSERWIFAFEAEIVNVVTNLDG